MTGANSELRLPADPAYIVVAKRAAAGFATVAGFDVEAVHDLVIAVAQACENAIGCAQAAAGHGQLKLTFNIADQRVEVGVQSSCSRAQLQQAAQAQVRRMQTERLASVARQQAQTDLALRLMGLFVDDCTYRLDERSGGLRVRLTKYRVS